MLGKASSAISASSDRQVSAVNRLVEAIDAAVPVLERHRSLLESGGTLDEIRALRADVGGLKSSIEVAAAELRRPEEKSAKNNSAMENHTGEAVQRRWPWAFMNSKSDGGQLG